MDETTAALSAKVDLLTSEVDRVRDAYDKILGRVEQLEKGHTETSRDIRHIRDLCDEMHMDLKDLKYRPAKRWESITMAVLQWAVLAALAAVVVFK